MKRNRKKNASTRRALNCLSMLLLFLCTSLLQAREVNESAVQTAVETWVRYVTADARPNAVVERMEPHVIDGRVVAYIAYLMNGGFCLCGADDVVLPVYLYSPKGTYDPQNPNYQDILWEIGTRTEYMGRGVEKGDVNVLQFQSALSERASLWEDLIGGRVPERGESPEIRTTEPDLMELDLTCRWDQGSPYNDMCPIHVNAGQRCVAGCQATALSQVMYYWRWPATGEGSGEVDYNYRWRNNWDEEPLANNPNIPAGWGGLLEYDDVGDVLRMNGDWDGSFYDSAKDISENNAYRTALRNLYNRLDSATSNHSANFGAATYDWSILGDTVAAWDPGAAEVAEICYHAGIACGMDYGMGGSGAPTEDVLHALQEHFRYDYDAYLKEADASAISDLTDELLWLRPVHMRGVNPLTTGHGFVVYGYNKTTDPDRQFLTNMGHKRDSYEWYTYDNIPYSDGKKYILRIAPIEGVKFIGAIYPGDGSPNAPYEDIEEAIAEAPDDVTLIFETGSTNTFSATTLVIERPFTLKGYNVTIE